MRFTQLDLFVTHTPRVANSDDSFLFIPFLIALLSAVWIMAHAAVCYALKTRQYNGEHHRDAAYSESSDSIVRRNGGATVFSFMVARVLGCVVLLALSLQSLVRSSSGIHPSKPSHLLALKSLTIANVRSQAFSLIAN